MAAIANQSGATQNTGVDHAVHVIAKSVQDAARKAVQADRTAASKWDAFREAAKAIGLKSVHTKSPRTKNSAHSPDDPVILRDDKGERVTTTYGEVYDDVVNMAYSFLPAAEKRMIDKPSKGLSDDQKEAKRYAIQQRGSIVSKMGKQLGKLEGEAERSPSRNKSVAVRIAENLTAAKKWVQADDEPNYDPLEVIRGIDRAIKALHDALPEDARTKDDE